MLQSPNRQGHAYVNGEKKTYTKGHTFAEYTPWLKHAPNANAQVNGDFLSDYINSEEVRNALNIPSSVQAWE